MNQYCLCNVNMGKKNSGCYEIRISMYGSDTFSVYMEFVNTNLLMLKNNSICLLYFKQNEHTGSLFNVLYTIHACEH